MSPSNYEIQWQSTFINKANDGYMFLRGKNQIIDVLESSSLKLVQNLDTKGHGVFSSYTDTESGRCYLGCFGGHLFSVDLKSMQMVNELYTAGGVKHNQTARQGNGHLKLTQGIYDICLLPFKPKVLMCV